MINSVIDLIIRIKNGYLAKNEMVEAPYSRFKEAVLKKLLDLHFIKGYKVGREKIKSISIELLYKGGEPALTDVKIHSKPGQRVYVAYNHLKPVLSGFGYSILSTSRGIMTNKEARTAKVGGELLFSIW